MKPRNSEDFDPMSPIIYYFAYGSNMFTPRLQKRVPSARPLSGAVLKNHRLAWHKKGVDDSGKCDIIEAGDIIRQIYGVLFELDAEEKHRLDKVEQLGTGYDQKKVVVYAGSGTFQTFTYQALMKDASRVPYRWYKKLVIAGAREHGLPDDYIYELTRVKAERDSNKE